jgi:hypothetical protein
MRPDYAAALEAIKEDPRYQANLDWGEPRSGHPEGTVRAHIEDLEQNLKRLRSRLSSEDVAKLRLLIHTHDSFKAEAVSGVPISDPRSHASLARAFLNEFCDDHDLLEMVQLHDEPFALFRQFQTKGSVNQQRFEDMLNGIQDWNLFLAFNLIDGCTEGKSRDSLQWLFTQMADRVATRFTLDDVLAL